MITVVPRAFTKVDYDADHLAALAAEALALVPDLPGDLDLEVRVDEQAATTRSAIASLDPLVFTVDSGALEDLRDPRRGGDAESRITFANLFLELADRRSAGFGAPPLGAPESLAHRMAWQVNRYGRIARLGLRLHAPRFRYDFRNRHGFSDQADRIFDVLWSPGGLTYARIAELSDEAAASLAQA